MDPDQEQLGEREAGSASDDNQSLQELNFIIDQLEQEEVEAITLDVMSNQGEELKVDWERSRSPSPEITFSSEMSSPELLLEADLNVSVESVSPPPPPSLDAFFPCSLIEDSAFSIEKVLGENTATILAEAEEEASRYASGLKQLDVEFSEDTSQTHHILTCQICQLFVRTVDRLLDKSEQLMDHYLPLTEEEIANLKKTVEELDDSTTDHQMQVCFARISNLSGKLRQRAYMMALSKLRVARRNTEENLSQLQQTIDLIGQVQQADYMDCQKSFEKLTEISVQWSQRNSLQRASLQMQSEGYFSGNTYDEIGPRLAQSSDNEDFEVPIAESSKIEEKEPLAESKTPEYAEEVKVILTEEATPPSETSEPEVPPTPPPEDIQPEVPPTPPEVIEPEVPPTPPEVIEPEVPPTPPEVEPEVPPTPPEVEPEVPPSPPEVEPEVPTPPEVEPEVPTPPEVEPEVPPTPPEVIEPEVPPTPPEVEPEVPPSPPEVIEPEVPPSPPEVIEPEVPPTPPEVIEPEVPPTPPPEDIEPEVPPTPPPEVIQPEVPPSPPEDIQPEVPPTPPEVEPEVPTPPEVIEPEVPPSPPEVIEPEVPSTPPEVIEPEVPPTPPPEDIEPEVPPIPPPEVILPEVPPSPPEDIQPEVPPTPPEVEPEVPTPPEVIEPEVPPSPPEVIEPEVPSTPPEVIEPEVPPTPPPEVIEPEVPPTPPPEVIQPETPSKRPSMVAVSPVKKERVHRDVANITLTNPACDEEDDLMLKMARSEEETSSTSEVEARTLAMSRSLTSNLKDTYESLLANLKDLPTHLQNKLYQTCRDISELHSSFASAHSFGDLSSGILNKSFEVMAEAQGSMDELMEYALQSPKALLWLKDYLPPVMSQKQESKEDNTLPNHEDQVEDPPFDIRGNESNILKIQQAFDPKDCDEDTISSMEEKVVASSDKEGAKDWGIMKMLESYVPKLSGIQAFSGRKEWGAPSPAQEEEEVPLPSREDILKLQQAYDPQECDEDTPSKKEKKHMAISEKETTGWGMKIVEAYVPQISSNEASSIKKEEVPPPPPKVEEVPPPPPKEEVPPPPPKEEIPPPPPEEEVPPPPPKEEVPPPPPKEEIPPPPPEEEVPPPPPKEEIPPPPPKEEVPPPPPKEEEVPPPALEEEEIGLPSRDNILKYWNDNPEETEELPLDKNKEVPPLAKEEDPSTAKEKSILEILRAYEPKECEDEPSAGLEVSPSGQREVADILKIQQAYDPQECGEVVPHREEEGIAAAPASGGQEWSILKMVQSYLPKGLPGGEKVQQPISPSGKRNSKGREDEDQ